LNEWPIGTWIAVGSLLLASSSLVIVALNVAHSVRQAHIRELESRIEKLEASVRECEARCERLLRENRGLLIELARATGHLPPERGPS
jgi:prefoldin subunit 5